MALFIQTNVSSMEAQKNLGYNQSQLQLSFNRLSSGFRINSAKDDAAGLAISENLKSQIRSFTVAERNAGDGISMAQTAEGSLGEVHNILGRMRELAVQASNGSLTGTDRGFLQTEFSQLQSEITRIQGSAKFNGKQLLGATANTISLQVGLDAVSSDQIRVTLGEFASVRASALRVAGRGRAGERDARTGDGRQRNAAERHLDLIRAQRLEPHLQRDGVRRRTQQLLAVELGRALDARDFLLQLRELRLQEAAVRAGQAAVRGLNRQLAHAGASHGV